MKTTITVQSQHTITEEKEISFPFFIKKAYFDSTIYAVYGEYKIVEVCVWEHINQAHINQIYSETISSVYNKGTECTEDEFITHLMKAQPIIKDTISRVNMWIMDAQPKDEKLIEDENRDRNWEMTENDKEENNKNHE